jgi:SH3-like domain-containing protein
MVFLKKLFSLICLVCVFLLNAGFVLALEIDYSNVPGFSSINDTSTSGEIVCAVFGFAQNLAILIATISIIFGGVYYLISYGRGKFTSEAKDWIKAGISGLLLVVCAILIIQTINPAITSCKTGILSAINFNFLNNTPGAAPGVEVITYKEIPIGVLTENLLTRKINCYGFDQEGNPVNGDKIDGKLSPTYMNHDRADCLTQLADGAQKKSQVIASLSDKIIELMNKCNCQKEGSCDPTCGGQCGKETKCPGGACIGPCVGGSCEQSANTTDCCPKDSGVADPKDKDKLIKITTNLLK